jgi:hypothetical protein
MKQTAQAHHRFHNAARADQSAPRGEGGEGTEEALAVGAHAVLDVVNNAQRHLPHPAKERLKLFPPPPLRIASHCWSRILFAHK